MLGTILSLVCISVFHQAGAPARQDTPPPWQRVLTGKDGERAEQLTQRVEELIQAGKFSEAREPAESLAALREKIQGTDHWQTQDAKRYAADLVKWAKLRDQAHDVLGRISAKQREAHQLSSAGRYPEALPLLDQILALRLQLLGEDHRDVASSFNNIGDNLYDRGKYAEAGVWFRRALELRQKVLGDEHPHTAESYNSVAAAVFARGDYGNATAGLEKAAAIRLRVLGEEHADTAESYYNLGVMLYQHEKYSASEKAERQALAIRQRILGTEHALTASTHRTLAYSLAKQGRYEEAWKEVQAALTIQLKVSGEEHPATAGDYYSVAVLLADQGKYEAAIGWLQKALAIQRKVLEDEHPETVKTYSLIANCLQSLGRYTESTELLQRQLAYHLKVSGPEHVRTFIACNNLATVLGMQGKHREAIDGFNTALTGFRKLLGEQHRETAKGYQSMAFAWQWEGNYLRAEELFQKSLAIFRSLGEEHPDTARAYNNLALNFYYQDKYAEATEGFQKCLKLRIKLLGEDHSDTAHAHYNLSASLVKQGRHADADMHLQIALNKMRDQLGDGHPMMARIHYTAASNRYKQGQYVEAENAAAMAAAVRAGARRFMSRKGTEQSAALRTIEPEEFHVALLARNGKPVEAAEALESSMAQGLLGDLAGRQRPISPDLRHRRLELLGRIDALDQLLQSNRGRTGADATTLKDRLNQQLIDAQAALSALDRDIEDAFGPISGKSLPWQAIQRALPEDAALLAWVDPINAVTDALEPRGEHWAVLLRSKGDPVVVRLTGSHPAGAPERLREALLDPRSRLPDALVRDLATNRFACIAEYLSRQEEMPAVRRLIVLPSWFVASFPLELLAPSGVQVSYAPSGSLLAYLKTLPALKSDGLLVMGDPEFEPDAMRPVDPTLASSVQHQWLQSVRSGSDKLAPLPGTAVEVERLRKRFQSAMRPAHVGVGSEASELKLAEMAATGELKKYRYLHFGTHGVIDHDRPSRSAIILSRAGLPDPAEQFKQGLRIYDGKVTVEEIVEQWELDADLVVLSACETALGQQAGGEGFIGFAQALLTAGVRSVVVSLWKVDDTATALLMDRFYGNLLGQTDGLDKPMPKAEALSEAKRWLRELPSAEAAKLVTKMAADVERGKGRVSRVDPNATLPKPASTPGREKPYEHPYYWAAFILIGDPD